MFRFSTVSAVAFAALTVVACSDDVTSPSLSAPQSPNLSVQSGREDVVPGDVIVRTVEGVSAQEVGRAHGLDLAEVGYHGAFAVLRGAAGAEHANARALKADSRVVYAEPNYLRHTTTIDPRLWAFYNPGGLNMKYTRGQNSGSFISSSYASVADADEDNVEGYAAGGSAVVIGSIDTGVDFTHPEFKNADGTSRLIAGRDWYSNDNDPTDTDDHGTHTTGTMDGNTVGIAGVSGAAPNV
ncbi:MAG TPA: S8 family serine peptidase, partial [Gemmatimonadaceae bacterium]|nr:S8 family serine peptidase [Gemmatimonadaceae bacterium]